MLLVGSGYDWFTHVSEKFATNFGAILEVGVTSLLAKIVFV